MLKKRREMDEISPPGPETRSTGSGVALGGDRQGPSGEKTVIGERISIEGSIQGEENLLIEGSMKGRIELKGHQVTVGPKGRVEAEIHARAVTISGRMTGNVLASGKVEITREAEFNGEIKAGSVSVEDGAYIKAVIELEREGAKRPVAGGKPDLQVASSRKDEEPVVLSSGAEKGK